MRKRLAAAATVIFVGQGHALAQTTDIAEKLAAEIRDVLPGASVKIPDPYGLDITYQGQTRSVGIGSVHQACALGVSSCDAAIHGYAQRAASYMLETAPLLPSQLTVVVRSQGYLDNMRNQMNTSDNFVSEPLVGDILTVCYRDLPQGRRPIVGADLPRLQLDSSTALAECKKASRGALPSLASEWKALPERGIGIIQHGQDDVTAYLTSPDEWRPLAERLGGLIVALPSIDILLYGRGSNAVEVDALATLATRMHADASQPVSPRIYRWTADGWVVVGG